MTGGGNIPRANNIFLTVHRKNNIQQYSIPGTAVNKVEEDILANAAWKTYTQSSTGVKELIPEGEGLVQIDVDSSIRSLVQQLAAGSRWTNYVHHEYEVPPSKVYTIFIW